MSILTREYVILMLLIVGSVLAWILLVSLAFACGPSYPTDCDPRVQRPDPCVEGIVEVVSDTGRPKH